MAKPRKVDRVHKDALSCDRRRNVQTINQRVFPMFMPSSAKKALVNVPKYKSGKV